MSRSRNPKSRRAGRILAAAVAVLVTLPAQAYEPGEIVVTQGLACEQASEVEAVVTLLSHGEDIPGALQQINHGADKNRCFAGAILLTQYVEIARTFHLKDSEYRVHKVSVVGVGRVTPMGVVPQPLAEPVFQYIVSAEKAPGA